jgi:uncharacterized membrane protein
LSHLHYLPLSLPLYSILAGLYLALAALMQVGILRYAYMRIGIGPGAVLLLLLGSLLGSYFNIPLVDLPVQQVFSQREVDFFGMRYAVPVETGWPGTVIAVVAAVCNMVAHPVRGLGIALPVFVPSLTAGIVAILLSRRHGAALAYISGSMGTLIGADLLNLGAIRRMGAPVTSIGGAGTFDGIFLAGILAVLIASLSGGGAITARGQARR